MLLNLLHHLAVAHAIDGFQHKIEILSGEEGVREEIIHEGRLFGAAFAYFGSHHLSRHHLLLTELRLDIEGADAIDLIAEKIEAKRQFIRKRIDIHNAASDGILTRLIYEIHTLETEFDELLAECPLVESERVKAILAEEMAAAASLSVPLTAEANAGHSWAEAH